MMEEFLTQNVDQLKDTLESRRFDPTKEYKEPEWKIKRFNKDLGVSENFAVDGSVILIKALPGARKSSFLRAMLSGVYNDQHSLGFSFQDSGNILWIDTEQPEAIFAKDQNQFRQMLGFTNEQFHERVYSYILTPDTPEERIAFIDYLIDSTPDVKYVVIDQIARLVTDFNNAENTVRVASRLLKWGYESGAFMFPVIHTNNSNSKANGTFGSELERVVSCSIHLKQERDRNTDRSLVENLKVRGTAPMQDFYIMNDPDTGFVIEENVVNFPTSVF